MLPFFISDEMGFSDEELLLMCAASGGKTVEDTETGNPLTFTTDLARPLKSLLIPFTPQQEGTGDPSPSNIRSILPWNGLTFWNGGINLWDEQWVEGRVMPDGSIDETATTRRTTSFIPVAVGTYKQVSPSSALQGRYALYDKDKNLVSYEQGGIPSNGLLTIVNNRIRYVRITFGSGYGTTYNHDISINYPSTETEYKPYTGEKHDISFPSAVYGGTLDVVSGVLTVTHGIYTLTGNEEYGSTGAGQHVMTVPSLATLNCKSFADKDLSTVVATFAKTKTYNSLNVAGETDGIGVGSRYIILGSVQYDALSELIGEKICYELATPVEIQLTPSQITALIGDNTIWSDADGQMTAVYLKKG